MPLSNLIQTITGTCPFCHQKAGILSHEHQGCRRTHQAGWNEMVQLAAQAMTSRDFDEKSLRLNLAEIASRSFRDGATVNRVQPDLNWKVSPRTDHVPIRRDAQCCSALTQTN